VKVEEGTAITWMGASAERSLVLDLDRHRLDRQVCFLPFAMACQRLSIDARLGWTARLPWRPL